MTEKKMAQMSENYHHFIMLTGTKTIKQCQSGVDHLRQRHLCLFKLILIG